ncbi:MAG: HAD-IB family phosphatase [Methanomassiliicoccus sp.]|nr:HAD-IB family phosphatase [Methanomassiliicoccus sp.]
MGSDGGPGDDRPGGMSVLCDFDGTITLIDTAEYILDHHAAGDWRAVERLLEQGKVTIEQSMGMQFEMISISRDAMLTELDQVVVPRPGLDDLIEGCIAHDATFTITSAGMDFYIRHFMAAVGWSSVEIVAPEVTDEGHGVRFRFPPLRNPGASNFKEDKVLTERALGRRVVYIGDGTSDLWAALSADLAFAVRGSRLDTMLGRKGRQHRTFTDLREVAGALFPPPGHRSGSNSSDPEFMQ